MTARENAEGVSEGCRGALMPELSSSGVVSKDSGLVRAGAYVELAPLCVRARVCLSTWRLLQ